MVYGDIPQGLLLGLQPGAEDISATGTLVDPVDGQLFADMEGVTLEYGLTPDKGLILVSSRNVCV